MESNEKTTSRPQPGKRVLIYIRTYGSDEKGLAWQEEACLKFLDQHNYTLIAIIKEDGISENADIEARSGPSSMSDVRDVNGRHTQLL